MSGRRPCPPGPGRLTQSFTSGIPRLRGPPLLLSGSARRGVRDVTRPGVSLQWAVLGIGGQQTDAMIFAVRGAGETKRVLLPNFLCNLHAGFGRIRDVLGKE